MPSSRLFSILAFVFVHSPASAFAAVPIPKPPAIDARAYVLIDFQSGRVLRRQAPTCRASRPASPSS